MITYTEKDGHVVLDMGRDDFDELLLMLGYAAGASRKEGNMGLFWRWIELANRVNATNPGFTPYEVIS